MTDAELAFDSALCAFVVHAQAVMADNAAKHSPNLKAPIIEACPPGPRYIRLARVDGPSRSAYCFIDRQNGDVLFPKSWKAPAKHARGNIFRSDTYTCVGPYGVASLR